jgi:sugar O-acyltransferase (sialic acid O-acetyltransferase NeuD family)
MKTGIVIFGTGGYSACLAEAAEAMGHTVVARVAGPGTGARQGHWRVIEEAAFLEDLHRPTAGIIAVGDSFRRDEIADKISRLLPGFEFVSIIHPRAVVSPSAQIGSGSVVLAGAVVGAGVTLGRHALLFSQTVVEHGSQLGDFVSTAPGVMIGGDVTVGPRSFIGIGASVSHGVDIGHDVVVGAGAAVVRSCGNNVVLAGVPARIMRTRATGEPYLT